MFKNYLQTTLRNIRRNGLQSLIQIISLVIGLTAIILVGLYSWHELSYDRVHENFDRIYRLEFGDRVGQPTAPGHQIKQHFSEVENVVRLVNWDGKEGTMHIRLEPENDSMQIRNIAVKNYYWADSSIFEVFSFDFIQGDPKTALRDPFSVVLSESLARRFYGNEDPVGKIFGWLTITGVVKDLEHSHMVIDMLISMVTDDSKPEYPRGSPGYLNNYAEDYSYITFLLLPENNRPRQVEESINAYFRENTPVNTGIDFDRASYSLRPLKEIYFSTEVSGEKNYARHGNRKMLYMVLTIAVFILILGMINYVNLTTARASLRAREIGIRKVCGSSKGMLVRQILTESFVLALLSFLLALFLVFLLLPGFNQLAQSDVSMRLLFSPVVWPFLLLFVLLVGSLSGIYPAMVLTAYRAVDTLYGHREQGNGSIQFRRILLSLQYIISIFLLISVQVVYRQLNYMKNADTGFNRESVVNVNYWRFLENPGARDLVKEELEKIPGVLGVAFSNGPMGVEVERLPHAVVYEGEKLDFAAVGVDPDFLDLLEIEILEGRNFSRERPADYASEENWPANALLNETAVRELGLDEAVGTMLNSDLGPLFQIIGVVEDIHFNSHHQPIEPCYYYWSPWCKILNIRLQPEHQIETLKRIEGVLEELEPYMIFDYAYMEDTWEKQYRKDEQTARIFRNYAIIAILLASLGVFGLSTFMAVRRTKEFGVRKIMGAPVRSITMLMVREFLLWVAVAVALASPLAWWLMNRWLEGFAYHVQISLWMYVNATVVALIVTLLTVLWQSLKAARANPVEALRHE